jgi:hypothetical protein
MLTKFVINGHGLVNFVRCILCLKAKGSKIINNQTFFCAKIFKEEENHFDYFEGES